MEAVMVLNSKTDQKTITIREQNRKMVMAPVIKQGLVMEAIATEPVQNHLIPVEILVSNYKIS
jgi:hypothetical protein